MRSTVLVTDAEGAEVVPQAVRDQWDRLDWLFESSGTSALARVRSGVRPSFAIINLQLPDMCGTHLVERLRKGLPNLPIMAMSNMAGTLVERLARPLGVVAYLAKPLDAALLDQILASVLRELVVFNQRAVESDTIGGE